LTLTLIVSITKQCPLTLITLQSTWNIAIGD